MLLVGPLNRPSSSLRSRLRSLRRFVSSVALDMARYPPSGALGLGFGRDPRHVREAGLPQKVPLHCVQLQPWPSCLRLRSLGGPGGQLSDELGILVVW